MIDWLEGIDRWIVLSVNSWNTPWLDEICWFLSARWPWIPLYLLLVYLSWKQLGTRKALAFIAIVGLTIVLVDISSVYLFKELFQRYRPSHHALLTNRLHFYEIRKSGLYRDGLPGFISRMTTILLISAILAGISLRPRFPKAFWLLVAISTLLLSVLVYTGVRNDGATTTGELYKGGMYGFVSSHATNFFAVTVLLGLALKQYYPKLLWILLGVSVVVCFTRLYLGVHYLTDLVCGALWGSLLAYLSYRFVVRKYILL